MKILLDAMGGDNAPDATIKGAVNAINQVKAEIVLIGKEDVIRELQKLQITTISTTPERIWNTSKLEHTGESILFPS